MHTVFIDGQAGTTGLKIVDRLAARDDIELLEIPKEKYKDRETKSELLNEADVVVLCLPDQAARESVDLIRNPATKVIDASTAHRTGEGWVYGLPELKPGQRDAIAGSRRVSVPGCYPTGFLLALHPLIVQDVVSVEYPVAVHGLSGYSGGGKALIERYENADSADLEAIACRPYALDLKQKHVPEMRHYLGLRDDPLFTPHVGNFLKGLLVSVPLAARWFRRPAVPDDLRERLRSYYEAESFVRVMPLDSSTYLEDGFLSPTACNDSNRVELFVLGNDRQILLVARLDNLGKGSSGAAVQCLNLMLGIEEGTGLIP
ncbi:MAG: N-acetyl-gamma-glutamyl-phosphate reductase [Proteobacteria bacterium]|nr:N-acetyl-gamma-glutamyl-phosphate reductase [Pseudomonadota bacterium]